MHTLVPERRHWRRRSLPLGGLSALGVLGVLLSAPGGAAAGAPSGSATSAPALVPPAPTAPAATPTLAFRTVEGAGGVPLNVVSAGDPSRPAILLIHGLGQSYLSFEPQLHSALALAKDWPGASVRLYEGVGHSPFVEAPARFNAELAAFAAQVLSGSRSAR